MIFFNPPVNCCYFFDSTLSNENILNDFALVMRKLLMRIVTYLVLPAVIFCLDNIIAILRTAVVLVMSNY
mgnify:CR=1 FL=1